MSKILLLLIFLPFLSSAQDDQYTLPIVKARMLVYDAFRARYLDTLLVVKDKEIDSLKLDLAKALEDKDSYIQADSIEDKINTSMIAESGNRINDLEEEVKQGGRWKKFWKGLSATLAAAVVVETIIIIAKD